MVGDCGAETGDLVVFGFVVGAEGAEHEGCFVVEGMGVGEVGVDLGCGREDGDVDGDHFGWVWEGGLVWAWDCVDRLGSVSWREMDD